MQVQQQLSWDLHLLESHCDKCKLVTWTDAGNVGITTAQASTTERDRALMIHYNDL